MRSVPKKSPAYVVAACLALAAFAVAIVAGLMNSNPAGAVLWRAILAMIVCYPIGLIVGVTCQRVIDEHVRLHRNANPVPDSGDLPDGDEDFNEVEAREAEEIISV